jgi:hypothetical protein
MILEKCAVWVRRGHCNLVFTVKVEYSTQEIIARKPVREHPDLKEMVHKICLN